MPMEKKSPEAEQSILIIKYDVNAWLYPSVRLHIRWIYNSD